MPSTAEVRHAVETGGSVWLMGQEYVPAPRTGGPIAWQFQAGEPLELVAVLGGQTVYSLVGGGGFPHVEGWHRRLVRAALEHALEQLEASQ